LKTVHIIHSLEEAKQLAGREVGVSDWIEMTQERIDRFSVSSDDHQWIHIDVARAKAESPYGGTIAHGFLTLSLMSTMLAAAVRFELGGKLNINYGLNRVRFPSAVPAGARVRGRFVLQKVDEFEGGVQFTWGATVEVEGGSKPCVVAEWLTRQYY
jgi:acyl dehydratase